MTLRDPHWTGIEPGDIGFDGGVGVSGWFIRRSTGMYGHCWVYHELIKVNANGDQVWRTVEAGPKEGVIFRTRTRRAVKVVRLWRNPHEQSRILAASEACVGAKYGWGEIARIVWHMLGIKYEGRKDNPDRMICSNHVAQSASAISKGMKYTLPYKPHQIWPQRLAEWCDWITWTRQRNADRKPTRYFGVDNGGYL
jgi:hypothetical protein